MCDSEWYRVLIISRGSVYKLDSRLVDWTINWNLDWCAQPVAVLGHYYCRIFCAGRKNGSSQLPIPFSFKCAGMRAHCSFLHAWCHRRLYSTSHANDLPVDRATLAAAYRLVWTVYMVAWSTAKQSPWSCMFTYGHLNENGIGSWLDPFFRPAQKMRQ